MSKRTYRVVIGCFALILLSIGTYIGFKISDKEMPIESKNKEASNNEVKIYENVAPVINNNLKDIEVIYETYYKLCSETVDSKATEYSTTIEDVKKKNKEYELVEENKESIKYRKVLDTNCPNHFLLKTLNGMVAIYQIESDEKITLYKSTEVPINTIREEIAEELKNGIRVNSMQELNTIMEDIES